MYIENINGPADVKKLNIKQMTVLASEIRDALLTKLSRHGGHFGPNFGMVEATIALHYVFESPKDKFVFDVSHQSYPHKMLTGRKDAFLYEEHYDDVSGYSNPHGTGCTRPCRPSRAAGAGSDTDRRDSPRWTYRCR